MCFDFHIHTKFSDGTDSPTEIVKKAKLSQLKAIAITDHDTIDGISEAIEIGKQIDIKVIPGVEFGIEYQEEDLHILGLGVDHKNLKLLKMLDEMRRFRIKRAKIILKKLDALGFHINFGEVASLADGGISSNHIAQAMVIKGYVKNREEAFKDYFSRGKPAFSGRQNIEVKDIIQVIHESGGIAIIAHPCIYKHFSKNDIINLIKKYKFDGLEVYYPVNLPEETKFYESIAKKYGLFMSGGSDYHGENRAVELGCMNLSGDLLDDFFKRIN